uniref:Myb-like domain-containing protein n=1 Tax=Leptocylindrus danicus TaxID=163516 RepID=A0A6U2PH83_9STRA|mmetsp:Transcript_25893/g.38681  ORF Transcript_25893/g.38681 Transcript_25893/m.38681 type:complete len:201 (+) Transcript_25893:29-631(+)
MAAPNDTDQEHVSPRSNQVTTQQQIEVREETSYHDNFVDALENFGPSGRWDKMAAELGQPIDEVKLYAYRYMTQLQNADVIMHRSNGSTTSYEPTSSHVRAHEVVQHASSIPMSSRNSNFQNGTTGTRDNSHWQHYEQETHQQLEWNADELSLLGTLVAVYSSTDDDSLTENEKWKKIAAMLPGKSERQCRDQFLLRKDE